MRPYIVFDGLKRYLPFLPDAGPELASFKLGMPMWHQFRPQVQPHAPVDTAKLNWGRIEFDPAIADQGQTEACGGYSAHYAAEILEWVRSGTVAGLSPTYLWSKCNRGNNQGVMLSDILAAGVKFGVAPLADFPATAWYEGQGSPQADAHAARYRWESGHVLQGAAQVLDALSHRRVVVIGVQVGQNLAAVDGDGVSPPPQQIVGGHALCCKELFSSAKYGPCVGGPQSWGPNFGIAGKFRLPVSGYLDQPGLSAYALDSLAPDPLVDGPAVTQ